MTIEVTQAISDAYFPNGTTTDFPFDFAVIAADQIAVIDGNAVELSDALYTVNLDGDGEGGTVVFATAPTAADYPTLYIVSEPDYTQPKDFSNTGPSFDPEELTQAVDDAAVRDLHLRWMVGRALKVAPGVTPPEVGSITEGQYAKLVSGKLVGSDLDDDFSEVRALSDLLIAMAGGSEVANFADGVANTPQGENFFFFSSGQVKFYRNEPGVDENNPLFLGGSPVLVPAFTQNPSISGTAEVGQTLTGNDGTFENGTVSNRQWYRDGQGILNATSSTYALVAADLNALITYGVTIQGDNGSVSAVSDAVGPVQPEEFTPTQDALAFQSVRMPAENGENISGVNGGFHIQNTNDLMQETSAGDAPLFFGGSAIGILWKVPQEIYQGIRRAPILFGNDRMSSGTANNQLRLSYVSGADNGNVANQRKFRFIARDAASNAIDVYSATVPSTFSDWMLIVPREDGTDVWVDVFDLETGTKLTGPTTALPGGWQGLTSITNDLCIGAFRPAQFPQDASNLFTNGVGYGRGECAGLLMLDETATDAQLEDFALGADPMTVWTSTVRVWFPLTDGTALDLAPQTNRSTPVAFNSNLLQLGTVLPGSTARRQTEAKFLRVKDARDPALVPIYHDTSRGDFRVTLSMAGQTAGANIEAQVLDASGLLYSDWTTVGTAVASGDVDVTLNLAPRIYRARFRIQGSDQCELNSDIVVGPGILVNGQSQCDYSFGLSLQEVDNAVLTDGTVTFDAGVGERSFFVSKSKVSEAGGHLNAPAIYRAAERSAIAGNGFVAAANKMAESIPTHWPVIIIDVSVSGTTIADTLADGGSPDDRDMSDIYDLTNLLAGRDDQDRAVLTCWVQFWHSSGSIQQYAQAFMPPMLDGTTTTQVPTVDDWFKSGLSINPNFPFVHLEPNRIVATNATSATATNEDTRTEHLTRQNLRDEEANYAYTLGAPIDVHRLESDVFTHPDLIERYGAAFCAETAMQSAKPVIGLTGGYAGPVEAVSATVSGSQMDIAFNGPSGFTLDVLNGGAPTGFEVNNDKSGFTASIVGNVVRLTKTTGNWSVGDAVELKPGGPGNYGSGHDEAAFVNGAVINSVDGCLVRGTGAALVAA